MLNASLSSHLSLIKMNHSLIQSDILHYGNDCRNEYVEFQQVERSFMLRGWLNCTLSVALNFTTYHYITTPHNTELFSNNPPLCAFFFFFPEWVIFCRDRSQQQAEQSKTLVEAHTWKRNGLVSEACHPYINTPGFNVSVLLSRLPSRPDQASASSS